MPSILDLPCELIVHILQQLDETQSLVPTILAWRPFVAAYKGCPAFKGDIVRRQIPLTVLPYAILALAFSQRLEEQASKDPEHIATLLDKLYHEPPAIQATLYDLPLRDLLRVGRTHNHAMEASLAFAHTAWSIISLDKLVLSATEYDRVCRAFYRFEILSSLGSLTSESNVDTRAELLSRHAPWENEQLGCLYDRLDDLLSKGKPCPLFNSTGSSILCLLHLKRAQVELRCREREIAGRF